MMACNTTGRPREVLSLHAITRRTDMRIAREAKAIERQELARKAIRMRVPAETVMKLFDLTHTIYRRLEAQETVR